MPWAFDSHDLAIVPRILGLKHPYRFQAKNLRHMLGEYTGAAPHLIDINRDIDAIDVSHTLWHELGHAHQCERYFGGDYIAFTAQTVSDYGDIFDRRPDDTTSEMYDIWYEEYMAIPHEIEADRIADRYCKRFPLVRRV